MRSIRFSNPARRSRQRGFALILALSLAILFLGLIELMLIDASRALDEARRFRARVIAATLAENGAELAAHDLVSNLVLNVPYEDDQGTISGEMNKNPNTNEFTIVGRGQAKGMLPERATVQVFGIVNGNKVLIRYTLHSQ